MVIDSSIDVFTNATADNPYVFKKADFSFTDADGDPLDSVTISSIPDNGLGRLRVRGSAAVVSQTVLADDIGTITYHPLVLHPATPEFVDFTFYVRAGGELSSGSDATMTINLVSPDVRLRLRLFLEGPLR